METSQREQGGMYKILKIIVDMQEEQAKKGEKVGGFTMKELKERVPLCSQAIINNVSRLVKAGFLDRIEQKREKGKGKEGRRVSYKIKGGRNDFISNYLYN